MGSEGERLHELTTAEVLAALRTADGEALAAAHAATASIERAVDALVGAWPAGGRLIYVGAGTSGRIGVLDAAECGPTFGVAPERVCAVIAGGEEALVRPVEEAEDDAEAGARAIAELGVGSNDVVVALSASGTTPYTCAALEAAMERGSVGVAVTCVVDSRLALQAAIPIIVHAGPEIIEGSTRMKAGTAQKLVCNAISTAAFVRLGRVWGRHMVSVETASGKLRRRAAGILRELVGCADDAEAVALLEKAGDLPTALVMVRGKVDRESAQLFLDQTHGDVHAAIRRAGDTC